MKFEFLGYYASIWECLEHLDGGKASEISEKSILVCIDWILKIWSKQPQNSKIPKFFKVGKYPQKSIYFEFYKPSHHPSALCKEN